LVFHPDWFDSNAQMIFSDERMSRVNICWRNTSLIVFCVKGIDVSSMQIEVVVLSLIALHSYKSRIKGVRTSFACISCTWTRDTNTSCNGVLPFTGMWTHRAAS
jgi:hypothetical protein